MNSLISWKESVHERSERFKDVQGIIKDNNVILETSGGLIRKSMDS